MDCPVKARNHDCSVCVFGKEGLCDYPYIGAEKVVVNGDEIRYGRKTVGNR
uniref:Uncharacterized protein n=1 Tax=viral metagenome TaxID=1070528 RepID=A0A6M3LMW6_9ZZZZ